MNPEHPNNPAETSSLQKVAPTVTLEQLLSIKDKELASQQTRIENLVKVNSGLIQSISELTALLGELEKDFKTPGLHIAEEKIKRLFETIHLNEVYEQKIEQLKKDIEASDRRSFTVGKKLQEMHQYTIKQDDTIKQKDEIIKSLDDNLKNTEKAFIIKRDVLEHIKQKYIKDVGLLGRQLRIHHRGTPQTEEHVQAIETLQERNRLIETLQKHVRDLEEEIHTPKKVPPTPDIEIMDDGDVRVKLSSVRVSEPRKVEQTHKHSIEVEKPTLIKRIFSKVKKLF